MTDKGPFPLISIDKERSKIVVGQTRVQNYWGDSGLVVWMGQLNGQWGKGTYCGVQYDNPNPLSEKRTDGTHNGERLCTTPAFTCDFNPPRHLYWEVNPLVVSHFRTKYGEKVARFHDFELIKIAIARQFDVTLMDKALEDHLEWYKTYNPDAKKEWFHQRLSYCFPSGFPDGWDREGSLLHYARPGRGGEVVPSEVLKELGVEPLVRFSTIQHEEMKTTLREKGFQHHRRYTSLYDLKDISAIDGKVMDFAKGLAEINKNHQLEIVNKIIMINAPFFFRAIFGAISIFMDERTKDKVIVLGSSYKEELAKYIDPKFWPSFAGGKDDQWMDREGRVGQPAPEANPIVTHGVIGQPYDMENLFPAEKKRRKKEAEKLEKEKKK